MFKKSFIGVMTMAEVLVLIITSLGIVGVAGYTFYWLSLPTPESEFVLVINGREWQEHAATLYEKYYPVAPPREEWYTVYAPANKPIKLVLSNDIPGFYKGEPVGSHFFISPDISGRVGLIPPQANFTLEVGVFRLESGQEVRFMCGEYCFPGHDYMGFARIVAKAPTIREFDVYMHQFYISLDPNPVLDMEAQIALRDIPLFEVEVGDIVRINLHVTTQLEPEFKAMALASRDFLFEYETAVGNTRTFEFVANKVGTFDIFCGGIACGTGHELMSAKFVVHPPGVLPS